jgi:hypothetical protein
MGQQFLIWEQDRLEQLIMDRETTPSITGI